MKTWETIRRRPRGRRASLVLPQVSVRRALARIYSLFETNFLTLQAMLMMKGLMERFLHHETTLGQVCEKAKLAEEELFKLKNWKLVTK